MPIVINIAQTDTSGYKLYRLAQKCVSYSLTPHLTPKTPLNFTEIDVCLQIQNDSLHFVTILNSATQPRRA